MKIKMSKVTDRIFFKKHRCTNINPAKGHTSVGMHVQMCMCANFIQIEAFLPEGLREARETQEVNKLHTS